MKISNQAQCSHCGCRLNLPNCTDCAKKTMRFINEMQTKRSKNNIKKTIIDCFGYWVSVSLDDMEEGGWKIRINNQYLPGITGSFKAVIKDINILEEQLRMFKKECIKKMEEEKQHEEKQLNK